MLFRLFLLPILMVFYSHSASTQVNGSEDICNYREIREEGIQAMNSGAFPEATNLFWLALECPGLEPGHSSASQNRGDGTVSVNLSPACMAVVEVTLDDQRILGVRGIERERAE